MDSKLKNNDSTEYFSRPMTGDQVTYLNNLNGIVFEKIEIFKEFLIALTDTIYTTYMGDDVTDTKKDKENHYSWAFNKTIDDFEKRDLYFMRDGEHYYYYFRYFNDIFYFEDNKSTELIGTIIDFWETILSFRISKTKSEYDIFLEIYKNLNKYFVTTIG